MSVQLNDDPRFDEAEHDVDHGRAWRYREAGMPNPLTIKVDEWSTGITRLGEAEFMNGSDRDGNRWSVLVGSVVLTKKLVDGLVEEWNDATKEFETVATLGRVKPGEVVSIRYLGDVEGAQYRYPNFAVSRKGALSEGPQEEGSSGDEPAAESRDIDVPF